MMAASENDAPKVAELLRAGANATIRVRPVRAALRPHLVELHCAPTLSMMRYKLGCLLASMCGKHKTTAV